MSNTEKEWRIGIDFGTSNTCVIAYEAIEGKIYCDNGWGTTFAKIQDKFFNIPTLIAMDIPPKVDENNKMVAGEPLYYVGNEVGLYPTLRPFKGLKDAAREVTPNNGLFGKVAIEYPYEQCGLLSQLQVGIDDNPMCLPVRQLLVEFFKKVLLLQEGDEHCINADTVKKIVIGCPVAREREEGCQIEYEKILKGLLAECFTGDPNDMRFIGIKDESGDTKDGIVTVVSEPELAGVTYLFSENKREDKKVLVIDIGGGTTDFSVLEYKNGKPEAVNIGSCEYAGNTIDKIIFDKLPDCIPHSKSKCREWKEKLFSKKINNIITPYPTEELYRIDTEYKKGNKSFYIYYNDPPVSLADTGIGISKEITANVFDKIKEALEKALDEKKITGINTIFFVGGTSIIKPLREKLVDLVANPEKSYCVSDFDSDKDVVDMFGERQKKLYADWGDPLIVTCYNAVAIGACIKAMDNKVQPRPAICFIQPDGRKIPFEASKKSLLIKTENGVPFARYIVDSNFIDYWCKDPTNVSPTIDLNVEIEEEKRTIILTLSKQDCISAGCFSIIAILKTSGIDFMAYISDNKSTSYATVMKNKPITFVSKI